MSKEMMTTGFYELRDFTGNGEFWSASVKGKTVTIHFAKIGKPGTKASREFPSFKEALEFVEDRLKGKISEGYQKKAVD